MSDTFSRVCMVLVVCLLAVIAFKTGPQPLPAQPPYISEMRRTPAYKVVEVAPDAGEINEVLSKYAKEGGFEVAGAPIYTKGVAGSDSKVILILVQHL